MTTFPTDTYPLTIQTSWEDDFTVARDRADDGTPFIRQLGDSTWRTVELVFRPMQLADYESLIAYLNTNKMTEFDISEPGMSGETYRGYLWGRAAVELISGLYVVSIPFLGTPV